MNLAGPMAWSAVAGYLAWLLAGCGDFACHRRTDLAHTSGLAESSLHLMQLVLVGAAVVVFMAFEVERGAFAALLALVATHAVVGYLDTRSAFGRREIAPVEQHVHSVLDMAPWIALAWVALVYRAGLADGGWALRLRDPAAPLASWVIALAAPFILCVLPAAAELRGALAARRGALRGAR